MASTPERTTNEIIFQACMDLHNAHRQISRKVLREVTGLSMIKIDDHVTRMIEAENPRLRRVANGIFEIVEVYPANRKFNKAIMRDGMIEITLGGDSLEMTPSEAAVVGVNLMGEATLYAQLRGDRDVTDKVARLEREAAETRKRLAEQAREITRLRQQPQLAFD